MGRILLKWASLLLALCMLAGVAAGCSEATAKNEDETASIKAYLKNEFNGPDQETKKMLDDFGKTEGGGKEFKEYLEKHYKPYVQNEKYKDFVNMYALVWLRKAYGGGYQMKVKDMDIQKTDDANDTAYTFTLHVDYHKEDEKAKTAKVTGLINLDKDDKISRIRNLDDGGLLQAMTSNGN
ncbi:hypothetical protein [Falsibacillus albus]|uniref:DUF5105 domain-containing protein n=1 Tax=Falsibacillus albus TaxID=2478915 RepID=A0A3L7JNR7_9BACI|nr:hypothetical protein [Falsibacillus albus]RLQ92423.1 hypothetical protein D9X91_19460 [Falsibacillus albus]